MSTTFGEKLKKIRNERNMSQEELANLLGTSKQVISRYETNQRAPKITVVEEYAKKLQIPLIYLLDNNLNSMPQNIMSASKRNYPLLGNIACGQPIWAEEDLECMVPTAGDIHADFCLRAQGDSMVNADIYDGDIVFIREQPDVDDGEIAVVLIDDEATLKRVYRDNDSVTLVAENPRYRPMIFSKDGFEEIRILGKAIAVQREIK